MADSLTRFAFTILGFVLPASIAMAQPSMNALCHSNGGNIQGSDLDSPYDLASVSKIVTSFWAIDSLTPDYRFTTTLYITPATGNLVDVHIAGGGDPYFGRDMMYFLVSELNRNGIHAIHELSFDENFFFDWVVREKPTVTDLPTSQNIENALRANLHIINRKAYQTTLVTAAKLGVSMVASPVLSFQQVSFVPTMEFQRQDGTTTLALKSAPLYRYLKEMNRNSNNDVADHIFTFLGGADRFSSFIGSRLNLNDSQIHFVNGSGDDIIDGPSKLYNEGSCNALMVVLKALRGDLLQTKKYDLQDVMAVAGSDDDSTLGYRYAADSMAGAIIAKTGTVDPAVTLAGMMSTAQGDVFFGVLYHTRSPADWNNARNDIRNQVASLMTQFGGKVEIGNYISEDFMPFDSQSALAAPQPLAAPQVLKKHWF